MASQVGVLLCLLVAPPAAAFLGTAARSTSSTQLASSSYLDSLGGGAAPTSWAPAAPAAPAAASNTDNTDTSIGSAGFAHAPLDFFALSNLSGKGPRSTADWGTPADATRSLADDGLLRSGAWYCSEGGWPSPSPKAHTEIFFVLDGHGALGDADGAMHYFGPGDTVIIPKGHTGRWDVNAAMHKIWAVNAHERVEETGAPIRTQVEHYAGCAPNCLNHGVDALYGTANLQGVSSRTFYDVGPTKVGYWAAEAGTSLSVENQQLRTFFYVMEGVLFITDGTTGVSQRCVAGDTVQLPRGWAGTIDVVEPVRKMYTLAD